MPKINLNFLKNKKTWIILGLIFVFGTIIIVSIINTLNPKPPISKIPESPIVKSSPEGQSTEFNNVEYQGTDPDANQASQLNQPNQTEPEESFNLYSATINKNKTLDVINQISKALIDQEGLQKTQTSGNIAFYANEDYYMTVDFDLYELTFSKRKLDKKSEFNAENALNVAQVYVDQLFPNLDLQPINSQIKYFKGLMHLIEASKIDADFVEVPYTYFYNQLPLFIDQDTTPLVSILIDSNNSLQKLEIKPLIFDAQQQASIPKITVEEALKNINQRKMGSIILIDSENPEPIDLNTIKKATLNQVELEQRFDSELGLIYPFYRFSGTFIDKKDQEFEGVLITPATIISQNN